MDSSEKENIEAGRTAESQQLVDMIRDRIGTPRFDPVEINHLLTEGLSRLGTPEERLYAQVNGEQLIKRVKLD